MRTFFFIAFLLIAIAAFIAAVVARKKFRGVPAIAGAVGVLFLIFALALCWTVVPARSVGIKIAFGKTTGALDSGLHFRAPWEKIEKYPATIQSVKYETLGQNQASPDKEKPDGPCITVRLGNQTTACVSVTTQWQLDTKNKAAIENLYVQWRSFDKIEENIIKPQIRNAMLQPFETFNPLGTLAVSSDPTAQNGVAPTGDLGAKAKGLLQNSVGNGITITSLTINLVNYDATTQDRINAFTSEQANTRIAVQREQTAAATSRANQALAANGSNDPGVLYQNCLDRTSELVKEGKTLPAAWSCGAPPQSVVNVNK